MPLLLLAVPLEDSFSLWSNSKLQIKGSKLRAGLKRLKAITDSGCHFAGEPEVIIMANKAQQRQYPQAPTTVTATTTATTTTTDKPLHTFCAFATTWASSGSGCGSRYGYGWGSWQVRLRLRVCPHYQVNYMCVCVSVRERGRRVCVCVCVRVTKGNYNYASIVGAASVGCQWCSPLLFPTTLFPSPLFLAAPRYLGYFATFGSPSSFTPSPHCN